MKQPIIVPDKQARIEGWHPINATGQSFDIHEWSGSGPDYLHVHYSDDEAWHILEGTLTFRFSDRIIEAPAGTTVFVPAASLLSFAGVEKVISVKDGKTIEVHVTSGRRNGDRVEIVEGLKAGVPVILDAGSLAPGPGLQPGRRAALARRQPGSPGAAPYRHRLRP